MITQKKKTTIAPIVPLEYYPQELCEADVALLVRRAKIRAELKKLDAHLKPRIDATVEEYGTGMMKIGDRQIKITSTTRHAASWKSLAHGLLDPALIAEHLDNYTVKSTSTSCKVVF